MNYISKYVDRNVDKLSTTGPVKRTLFTDTEREQVFQLLNITKKEITAAVTKTSYIKNGTVPADPFNIIMTLIIRFFKITKQTKEMNASILYLTLSMYPSIHYKYFKFEPNEQIMEYTVNNMSNKYKLRKSGTVLAALTETTVNSDTHYSKELVRGNDKDIADYILSFKTRINGLMKNISDAFYKEHKAGRYLNYEVDNEEEGNYSVADNNSYLISRTADAVSMNLSVGGPNAKIIKLSAKIGNVSINDLRNTIYSICKHKETNHDVKEMVRAILYLYLFDGSNTKEELNSNKFLLFCLEIYKKANTTDDNIVKIKTILDKWLNMYSETYKKSNAVATINGFRKALFVFFVFTIQRTKA